ncbi:MAG TPA: zinc metalloprotease HtpX [Candidatus Megamonas gallistercoris]|nr:zinc metalloprotease HtpX [Candidatus Megamonas gallistercoris]
MNTLKTTVLMAALMGILIAIGGAVGGSTGALVMFVISLGMNIFMYWNSADMCLKAYGAQEITREDAPNLYDLVERLAKRAELPMPRVCIIEADEPNAFATGRNPEHAAVAVTTGIMRVLNYEELAGVLSHELAHVKHRDILISTIAASMAGAISMIANIAQFAAIFGSSNSDDEEGSNPIALLATAIIAPIAASVIQMAVSRSREYDADAEGGNICGNPLYLADALEKIDYYARHGEIPNATPATAHMFIINPFEGAGKKLANLFSTHPLTEDRIARLHEQASRQGITTV